MTTAQAEPAMTRDSAGPGHTGSPDSTGGAVSNLSGRHGLDVLFAGLLLAIALSGWATTYEGPGWIIVAAAAAILGVLVAISVVDYGLGAEFVLAILVPTYLMAAGPIAAARVAFPDGQTLIDGITETGTSWYQLLVTHPPVDAIGPPLLPVLVVSLFAPALAVSLAVRSNRMLAPLAPLFLALIAVLAMGQYQSIPVVVQGLTFGGVSVVWMRMRAGRLEERRTGVDPNKGRRLAGSTALVVAVSLIVAVGFAGSEDPSETLVDGNPRSEDRFLLRDQVKPYNPQKQVTPLDQFRRFTEVEPAPTNGVFDEIIARVDGAEPGTRLRFAVLDRYNGERFQAGNQADFLRRDDNYLAISTNIDNKPVTPKGDPVEVKVRLTGKWESNWIPTFGAMQSFEFDGSATADSTKLRYNPAAQSAVIAGNLDGGDSYTFTTVPTETDVVRTDEPAVFFDGALFAQAEFVDYFAQLWRIGSFTQVDALFKVAENLKKIGRYTDGSRGYEARFTEGHSAARLGKRFLSADPTAGNDEQYAAAFALLATRLRIPARVVVGAEVPKDGVIEGEDVSAWVEVRVADGSWRTVPTEQFMSDEPVIAGFDDRASLGLRDLPPPEDVEPPADDPVEEAAEDQREEEAAEESGPSLLWFALLGLVVMLVLLPGVIKVFRRQRRRSASSVSRRFAGAWQELVDRAVDLGHPMTPHTRPRQAEMLADAAGSSPDALGSLALRADDGSFSRADPDSREAEEFWDLVSSELSSLNESAPRWRRWWAPLSPASLRKR